jgi:tRNA A-37 threonylcarbamoyl transferase component Bud32
MNTQKYKIKYYLYSFIFTFIFSILTFSLIILLNLNIAYSASITYIPEEYQQNNTPTDNIKNHKNLKNKSKNFINNNIKKNSTENNNSLKNSSQNSSLNSYQNTSENYLNSNKTNTIDYLNNNYNNTIITNKKYHNLKLNIKNLNNENIPSNIKIIGLKENNNKNYLSSYYAQSLLEEDYLKIFISPINNNYQELQIEGQLTQDTNLTITLTPKKLNIIFNITDIYPNKIRDFDYNITVNSMDFTKLTKKEDNKLTLNLIENPLNKNLKLNDLSEYKNDNNFLIPKSFNLSILSKGYKDETISFKINPHILNFPTYSKTFILEKKFYIEHIIPYIYLALLIFPSIALAILAYYNRNKIRESINEILNKNKPEKIRRLKDTIIKIEQLNNTSSNVSNLNNEDNPKVSDYVLLEKLGVGATAVVYKAINQKTKNLVALKLIHKHILSEDIIKERVENEIEINKLLSHPNIVKLVDYNLDDNLPYIAFEYVEGKSLDKILKEKKKLNIYDTMNIWMQLLEALDYAHQKGIVHRDLKPENILLKLISDSLETATVKITDFGISKIINKTLNITQDFVGTPWYMSPEQIKGQKVDQRSDIYSLGIIIFQLLTGKLPFGESDNIYAVFKAHMLDNPVDSHILEGNTTYIPKDIEKIIRKMLEKNPKKRYQNISEIINDLKPQFIKYSTTKTTIT